MFFLKYVLVLCFVGFLVFFVYLLFSFVVRNSCLDGIIFDGMRKFGFNEVYKFVVKSYWFLCKLSIIEFIVN